MDLFEAIRNRHSCRRFSPRPIDGDKLSLILEAGTHAPSPGNAQPWEFGIVTGETLRQKIKENAALALKYHLYEVGGFRLTPLHFLHFHPLDDIGWSGKNPGSSHHDYDASFLDTVPAIVAVSSTHRHNHDGAEGKDDGHKYAVAAAIQNMLLAAHALGLGSLWFTLFHELTLKPILGISPEKHLVALVFLGYPEEKGTPTSRKPLESVVTYLD